MFENITAVLKNRDTLGSKGQMNVGLLAGVLFLVILAGIAQFITQNILNAVSIYTGLWTVLDTLWPVVAIFLVLGAAFGAIRIFTQ